MYTHTYNVHVTGKSRNRPNLRNAQVKHELTQNIIFGFCLDKPRCDQQHLNKTVAFINLNI